MCRHWQCCYYSSLKIFLKRSFFQHTSNMCIFLKAPYLPFDIFTAQPKTGTICRLQKCTFKQNKNWIKITIAVTNLLVQLDSRKWTWSSLQNTHNWEESGWFYVQIIPKTTSFVQIIAVAFLCGWYLASVITNKNRKSWNIFLKKIHNQASAI